MRLLKKKWLYVLIILIVGCIMLAITFKRNQYTGQGLWENYKTVTMEIEGTEKKLVVADNPSRWTQGLMYVRKPEGFDGMIFKFPDKQPRLFWNKNTLVNLTIYWMADEKIIGKSDLPSIEETKEIVTVSSPLPADSVIEIIK